MVKKQHGGPVGPSSVPNALYDKSVCEVCLNCEKEFCTNVAHGCDKWREAFDKVKRTAKHDG